jgi:rubrerythrin
MMNLYGVVKGTELEKAVLGAYNAESNGAVLYFTMGLMAKEKGMNDLAEVLMSNAKEELAHAGMYAEMLGRVPEDFLHLLPSMQQAKEKAGQPLGALADMVEKLGQSEAAEAIRKTIPQEIHHGQVLKEMLEKYKDEIKVNDASNEKSTCKVCGYEYQGDVAFENLPDDWKCPICGQSKAAFEKKAM